MSAQILTTSKEKIKAAFTQWDKNYRANPDTFMSEVQHLLGETPESYGEAAGEYFLKLILE